MCKTTTFLSMKQMFSDAVVNLPYRWVHRETFRPTRVVEMLCCVCGKMNGIVVPSAPGLQEMSPPASQLYFNMNHCAIWGFSWHPFRGIVTCYTHIAISHGSETWLKVLASKNVTASVWRWLDDPKIWDMLFPAGWGVWTNKQKRQRDEEKIVSL